MAIKGLRKKWCLKLEQNGFVGGLIFDGKAEKLGTFSKKEDAVDALKKKEMGGMSLGHYIHYEGETLYWHVKHDKTIKADYTNKFYIEEK